MNKVIMNPQEKKIARDKDRGKCKTVWKGKPQADGHVPVQISAGG